jgi:hypothetical protein
MHENAEQIIKQQEQNDETSNANIVQKTDSSNQSQIAAEAYEKNGNEEKTTNWQNYQTSQYQNYTNSNQNY